LGEEEEEARRAEVISQKESNSADKSGTPYRVDVSMATQGGYNGVVEPLLPMAAGFEAHTSHSIGVSITFVERWFPVMSWYILWEYLLTKVHYS